MNGKVQRYFAGGNTAKGFFSFYEDVLNDLDRLFILKGGPGTGKSSLMKAVGEKMVQKGLDIEYLYCSSDPDSVDGVIVPAYKVGIVDGTAPHIIEPKAPGVVEEYVNLGVAWDGKVLRNSKKEILSLNKEISATFQEAYEHFAQSLLAHDDLEHIYISNMDFEEANKLTEELITRFYQEDTAPKKSTVGHRFLGAATPKGAVDFIPNLTEGIGKRYFIKGRAGSGKSTMLKKIAKAGEERGFDVEVYHCGFDPNSVDMVIVREKDFAIFDSTAPHEYFPERESDEVVDMYERCITPGTDEKYETEIERATKPYKDKMKEGIASLKKAKELRDQLEAYYIKAMDFEKVEKIQQEVLMEIEQMINHHQ
ncbi:ATPase [Halalkalibacter wakoensis JCM 9140]|uniref:ATPase n=1 Tax=Halalkalibacter wakoensis JCM 9140 TaxID=1236970 RepID=W4Q9Q5_9BACI|nr:PRK06851 family protein [Halalkalibacter wakoensis]GAE28393.1 ATPase [Halalkalibacter wakoensis JCM 9140]